MQLVGVRVYGFLHSFTWKLKTIIHFTAYMITLAQIFATICSLDESTLVAESQKHSADFGQSELTDFTEKCVVYDGYRL